MDIAYPSVRLIAATKTFNTPELARDEYATDSEHLTEFAGRACYQSFNRPNPMTAQNDAYLSRTLFEQGHWSIAEHASASFYLEGVSRAFTHELVRHRHLSFSQLSQRFVDESDAAVVIPPALVKNPSSAEAVISVLNSSRSYSNIVKQLEDEGLPRKQAREAARAVLPNMMEAKIVVSGNLRAWHEFCLRRMQPDADAEMQQVSKEIFKQLNKLAPSIFPLSEIPQES